MGIDKKDLADILEQALRAAQPVQVHEVAAPKVERVLNNPVALSGFIMTLFMALGALTYFIYNNNMTTIVADIQDVKDEVIQSRAATESDMKDFRAETKESIKTITTANDRTYALANTNQNHIAVLVEQVTRLVNLSEKQNRNNN
jgi:soluble cytochrome b562